MKILIKNLSKTFIDADRELPIIKNLNWEVTGNQSIAIVGKSGVGKSTLLHILSGIEGVSAGSVIVGDQDITELNQNNLAKYRLQNIGVIFQMHNLLPEFTALENVTLPMLLAGREEGEVKKMAQELLKKVGLQDRMLHRPGKLSGGEQQRVSIARALANNPKLLLADEPTGSLDQETGRIISELLLEIGKEQQIALITVTHSMELAEKFDLIYKMSSSGHLDIL